VQEAFSRTALLLGTQAVTALAQKRVAVFGVGGVGGYVVEALARSGIGALDLIDSDTIAPSNLNRQIIATVQTIGMRKVDAAKQRVLSINPQAQVRVYPIFYLPETADLFDFSQYDYVVDAVDTVTAKLSLVLRAQQSGTPILCAMGAGNKLDPTRFEAADIYQTSVCPLARVMRGLCRKNGVQQLKVVYSKEPPATPHTLAPRESADARRCTPGSVAFVPAAMGLVLAANVIEDLLKGEDLWSV
jgi:tRNA A37 threonylcarbamoyladenosine dehydratase